MLSRGVTLLTKREVALTVLSKLLYAMTADMKGSEEIKASHQTILKEYVEKNHGAKSKRKENKFSFQYIPWNNILDSIASGNPFLRRYIESDRFSKTEIRYMCAMLCGLSGKEYGLITESRSHYNISWSIRQKFGLPPKTTNLRIFLQNLSGQEKDERP